jgi:hypothetical protein
MKTAQGIAVAALLAAAPAALAGDVMINEIRIDQPSFDNDEYFELKGTPSASLDGLTYLVIGDGTGGSGVIEAVIDLTGQSLGLDGLFLAAEATFTLAPGLVDLTTNLNFENSDNVTHLLVEGFSGADGDDLDTDDDGVLDATPWTAIVDLIALIEEDNPPTATEYHYGPPTVGPDGPFVPGHAYRCTPDGTWSVGDFDLAVTDTPGEENLACGEDSDGDGIPDFLDNCPDHPNPDQADCDGDGAGDVCEIAEGTADDCNDNGIPDDCEVEQLISPDCNDNGIPDDCDLADGTLHDKDGDGVPDECEVDAPEGLFINEIRTDQPGSDIDEYFELQGIPGTSLQGLRYLVIGDAAPDLGSGVIEAVVNLDGKTIPGDGLFLAVEDTFTLGSILDADLVLSGDDNGLNFENSDNVTHLLVANFIAGVGTDLDTDDDGTIDFTPWTDLLDAIGLVEEPNPPIDTEYVYGAALGFEDLGPDGVFVPGQVYRCNPFGLWVIGVFDPADPDATDTPGAINVDCAAPPCIGDIDGDGSVGLSDLLALLTAWGPCPVP